MQELMTALTEYLKEATVHLRHENGKKLLPPPAAAQDLGAAKPPAEEAPARTRKPRAAKEPEAAGPAAPALADLTEAQSSVKLNEAVDALIARFKTPVVQPDGLTRPEGLSIARKMLFEDFKVARLVDLVHAQRLQFITKAKDLIAAADKIPAPVPAPAASGIGI